MDFRYDETDNTTKIQVYNDDICSECFPDLRNVCPLLICISGNFVYPCAESMQMGDCLLLKHILEKKKAKTRKRKTKKDEPS